MSDGSASGNGARTTPGRTAKFRSILKGRRQSPVILAMIIALAMAMIYSLITAVI